MPSPLQKVVEDALVPLLKFVMERLPVTPVESGKPVAFVNVTDVGVPRMGVTSVGLVLSTLLPVPVEVVTPDPPLLAESVPVTPVARGKLVALVKDIDTGVPNAVTLPEGSNCGDLDAAIVMNTFLVPAENVTADPELDEL